MKEEIWRDIDGYKGLYQVSNMGTVKSLDRTLVINSKNGKPETRAYKGQIRKTPIGGHGYKVVSLSRSGSIQVKCVHSLVLTAFVGKQPIGMEACHGMEGRLINTVENLRWDTRLENIKDQERHGVRPIGEGRHNSKLNESQVVEIKNRLKTNEGTTSISRSFRVAVETIHSIKTGKSWKHVC